MADSPDITTGAGGNAYVPIEEKHGDTCTCTPMGHVHVELVAASRTCPGDRNPHRGGSITAQLENFEPPMYPGRIVITWGSQDPLGWQTAVHDADTGEMVPVEALRINLDANSRDFSGPIVIQARMLIDHNRQPLIGDRAGLPYPDPDGSGNWYAAWFRCPVAEMRIGNADAAK